MDKRHRQILFYDLTAETKTRVNTPVSQLKISDIFSEIHNLYSSIGPVAFEKKTLWLTIQEWQIQGDEHHLLINKSDSNKSDPTFSIPHINSRRTIRKGAGEGNETSSHVVIRIDPNNPQKALVLIERGALASLSRLLTVFLKGLVAVNSQNPEFLKQTNVDGSCDRDGNPNKVNLTVNFDSGAHLSSSFIRDLNAGRFLDATLTTEREGGNIIDGHQQFIIDKEFMKITPSTTAPFSVNGLKKYLLSVSSQYEKARIRFKKEDDTVKETDIDTASFEQMHYTKKELINSDGVEFSSAYVQIERRIIQKMKALF